MDFEEKVHTNHINKVHNFWKISSHTFVFEIDKKKQQIFFFFKIYPNSWIVAHVSMKFCPANYLIHEKNI